MDDGEKTEARQPNAPSSLTSRVRARWAAAKRLPDRIDNEVGARRERNDTVAAIFEMAEHDSAVGGGIMAGALAYRFFIFLLPLALVSVAGLGLAADAGSKSPTSLARSMGLAGLVSSSVANAANSPARWYALLIGIPILLYTARSLLRALIVSHRLIWEEGRSAAYKPTAVATLRFLVALLLFFAVSGVASAIRGPSPAVGLLITLIATLLYAALWLFIATRLPHRDATRRDLVPGALAFGVGLDLLHLVTAYFIAPQAISKQGTYGSLGAAAALLLGLFLICRLIVGTAVMNATLAKKRRAPPEDVG